MSNEPNFLDLETHICDLKSASALLIDIYVSEPDIKKSIDKMDLMFRLIEERANELHSLFYKCHDAERNNGESKVTELKRVA